jgi:hypothetical protein
MITQHTPEHAAPIPSYAVPFERSRPQTAAEAAAACRTAATAFAAPAAAAAAA